MIKLAIDAMGGDFAPKSPVLGAMRAIKAFKDLEITLYGNEAEIRKYLTSEERIKIVHTENFIPMDEHDPVRAIRKNPDASLVIAMKSCKNKENDGLVAATATQAIIVGAHMIIKRIPQMSRVALAPLIPSLDGKGRLFLDSGANTELRPEHLEELALYATAAAKVLFNVLNPRVGLLNIGTEEGKGRQVDQETYELLKNNPKINFVGNIETKDVLNPDCEVLLTDGFTGNMVIKTVEGVAKTTGVMLKQEIKRSLGGMIGALFMRKNLNAYKKRLNADEVGGAMLCGVSVPVVKPHGSSDDYAFFHGIRRCYELVKSDLLGKVNEMLPAKEGNYE